METPTPTKSTISWDLPIRTAKHVNSTTPEEPKAPELTDATPEQVLETAQRLMMDPEPRDFEQELRVTTASKKRNKHRRPKSKRGLGKPTGFEEYYADGPITPREYEEMRKIYDPSRPFMDRIEEALMRFQYKRRIESDRRKVFLKYLQYGGVTIGPNLGTGVDTQDIKEMTKDQIMQIRTQTAIQKEREKLEVSFNTVLRGFLSSYFMRYFNPDNKESIKLATVTIRNFYTYLLFHEVCPEYNEDLEEARKTCDLAAEELWKNVQLVNQGPGSFSQSCSMLFGGHHYETAWSAHSWKATGTEDENPLTPDAARKVVKFAIAGAGSNEQASRFQQLANAGTLSAKKIEDIDGFEIIAVIEPDASIRDFYHAFAKDLVPVGIIKATSFHDPAKPDIDMSPEERWEWDHGKAPKYDFEFLVEMTLLPLCYPGLKVNTNVWELNCGLCYFDEIISTYPTFYTVIANDLMLEWKWPKDLTVAEAKKPGQEADAGVESVVKAALKATGHAKHEKGENEKDLTELEQIKEETDGEE